jgi:GMP synthase (glutamine-hydrolysing)
VIQHVAPEGPGRIGAVLAARGIAVDVTRVDSGEPIPEGLDGLDGLVVMGGPMGVYEGDVYPHLLAEQRLIERAVAANMPILGVCLGSQLLAATLGAKVAPGPRKEIGWFTVTLEDGARGDPLFGAAPTSFIPLHWHGDVFDLPAGAVSLARSALTAHQAFRFGRAAYGLLFHLEATGEQVSTMVREFADELASAGVDGAALETQSPTAIHELAPLGDSVFGAWARLV